MLATAKSNAMDKRFGERMLSRRVDVERELFALEGVALSLVIVCPVVVMKIGRPTVSFESISLRSFLEVLFRGLVVFAVEVVEVAAEAWLVGVETERLGLYFGIVACLPVSLTD